MARVVLRRYAGIVFSVRVKDPQSLSGRFWNFAQNVLWMAPLVFIVLKLTRVISWSWWWVLSPWWIGGILSVLYLPGLWVVLFAATRTRMSLPDQPVSEDKQPPE